MTKVELMQEGINLMFSGMGFVLVFLFILIVAIGLMSTIINRFFPEQAMQNVPAESHNTKQHTSTNELEQLRPVIVAAIAHHRRSQGL